MALNDRKNGGMFKCRGSGNSESTKYTQGYTDNPGGQTGGGDGIHGRVFRYAYDQQNLLQRYYNYHIPSGLEEVSYNLDQYSSVIISSDRKINRLQLDIEQSEYYSSGSGYYRTQGVFIQVLELVGVEDIVMQGILDRTVEDAQLSVNTSNAGSNTYDYDTIVNGLFYYNSKWYLAIPRDTFKSISAFQTTLAISMTVDGEVYITGNLSEYISIKDTGGNTELGDFDYAVIRYLWSDSAGRDLDTRTRITTPPRNVDVGWSRSDTDSSYLRWGGDNTGSGVESVLIDVKALIANYPDIAEFIISLNAFWFSSVLSGVVGLEFVSYKGGSMIKSGYNFVNSGGVTVQTLNLTNTTFVNQGNDIDGEHLATVYFNPETKMGMFSLEETAPKPETPPTDPVAFNNFSMSPLNDNTVRVTFTNPEANYDLSQHWIVYRSDTPFQSAPSQSQVWDNKSGIINGVNTYDVTGTPGSTYYLAFALANTGNTGAVPINPIAYVTVAIPAVAGSYPAQKLGVTLRLREDGTAINATVTNPSSASYTYFRAWTKVGAPTMTSLDQATDSWQTSNSNASWDVTNVFTNIEEGVPYSLALALVTHQDTQTPVSEPTYVTFTKWGSLSYNIPKFSLTPVNTRMFSTTFDVDRISAPRGGWFDTSGNLWVYGIESAGYRGGLLQYILSTPFDVGTVTHVNRYVFDMKIGAFNNILSVNFINNGRICIVTANNTSGSGEKYVIARVCNTPYDIMSSVDNPNIDCEDLKTALATFEYPPLTINPETNKLACIAGNDTLKQIDLSYEEGVSTKLGVSAIKSTLLSSIINHNIWYSSIPVSGVQLSSDGLTILITQSRWGQSDNNARIMQFSTTVPFEFGSGTTLVEYSLDPFGNGQTNLYLGLHSPAYHPRSAFSGNNALLLISQNPIKIIQRGYTLV